MIPIDLSGKTALISGSSQGLGACMAQTLHQAGANVAINYYPDAAEQNRAKAAALAERLGERAAIFPGDVRDSSSAQALCNAAAAHFGSLQIVVNNAGITRDRTVAKMSDDEWNAVIDTNLSGVFYLCRAALPHLNEGGRIINIASISAAIGLFGQANYAAAKAGILGFTKTLSREVARQGVTANAIAPGLALTEMGAAVPEAVRDRWISNIPLGRFADPQEIANAVLFLASPLSSYITGQTLHVNGGWYL